MLIGNAVVLNSISSPTHDDHVSFFVRFCWVHSIKRRAIIKSVSKPFLCKRGSDFLFVGSKFRFARKALPSFALCNVYAKL